MNTCCTNNRSVRSMRHRWCSSRCRILAARPNIAWLVSIAGDKRIWIGPRRRASASESEGLHGKEARARAWIVHQCLREAFETEARRGCSLVGTPQAYIHAVCRGGWTRTTSTGERIGRRSKCLWVIRVRRSNVRCQSDVRRYRRAAESYGGTARAHPAASGPIQVHLQPARRPHS